MTVGPWLRRTAQIVLAALAATIALVVVTPPARACACGGAAPPPGRSVRITQETALVSQAAGRETIVMSLSARADTARAGLLVPTPAPAKPALADRRVFNDLEEQTAPREKVRHHVFGPPVIFDNQLPPASGDGGDRSAPSGVQVLGRVDLGPLEAVSLTATDAGDLHSWLDKHGFAMSAQFEALVTPYLEKGWAFTAMNLTAEGKSLTGDLPPVSLTFDSDRLTYPMRMSSGAKDTQHVTTYVLADHRVRRTDPTARQGNLRTAYADRIRSSLVTSADLKKLSAGQPWLTEFTQTFDRPREQVRSDFTFARAVHDEPVVDYHYTDEYFIPIDLAVILVLLIGGVAGGIVVCVRRLRRRDG